MTTIARDNRGKFARTLRGAERDAEACRLRASGHSYAEIAVKLGYGNKGNAHRAIRAALDSTVREGADELRALQLIELDQLQIAAWDVLRREHPLVSHGRVVVGPAGVIVDPAPVLGALDRLLRIAERRSKLLGLDAPVRSRVDVITTDAIDEEIAKLEAELANHDPEGGDGD